MRCPRVPDASRPSSCPRWLSEGERGSRGGAGEAELARRRGRRRRGLPGSSFVVGGEGSLHRAELELLEAGSKLASSCSEII